MELLNINYAQKISKKRNLTKFILNFRFNDRIQQRLKSIQNLSTNLVEFIERFQVKYFQSFFKEKIMFF